MKKFAVCSLLLLMSMPLFALGTGISIGVTGGVEMMMDGDSENWPAIGGTLNFSLPGIPIGIRGGAEYAWKSYDGEVAVTASDILIFLGGQYNISIPMAPLSFYIGAGGEMSMLNPGGDAETDNNFGVLGLAGVNLSTGMTSIFVEVGYGMIFSDPESTTHIPIRGGLKLNL